MLKHTTSYTRKRPRRRSIPTVGGQLPHGAARRQHRPGQMYLNHSQGFGKRSRGFRAGRENARKPYALVAVGCAFLFFMASVIWYMNRSVDITLNGEPAQVRINATIAQFIEDNDLAKTYDAGDRLAVDDSVLERGGGDRYAITLNDAAVDLAALADTHLEAGDALTIADGADTYEKHDVQATEIQPTIEVSGTGALSYVETWGIPGRSEVWQGHESGKTQDRGVVREVQNCVVRKTSILPDDNRKVIALTFDEGPSDSTAQIVDILKEQGVGATFFLSGDAVEKNPQAAQAIAQAGFEIGSNAYEDVNLTKLTADEARSQITRGFDAIEEATGSRPALLRPPYAAFDTESWTQAMDLVSGVVSWNVDSGDWLLPGAEEVVDTVTGSVRTGNIVLMTDNSATDEQAVEALPALIERLKEMGFEIVSLSELVASDSDLAEEVNLSKVSMPDDAVLPQVPAADTTEDAAASGA